MIFGVGNRAGVEARIRILGRPTRLVLVVFPLVLFVTGTVLDLFRFISGNRMFGETGFWIVSAGVAGALVAGVIGFAEWTRIPAGTRARRVGRRHCALNGLVLLLSVVAWLVRVGNDRHVAGPASFSLQMLTVGTSIAAAWLAKELADQLGTGQAKGIREDARATAARGL